jgi:hypothetical protein
MFGCLFVTLALTRRSELFGVRSDHCLKLLLVHLQKLFLAVSEQQAKLWDEEDTQRDNGQEENTRADQRKSNGAIRHQEDDNNEYYHETEVVHGPTNVLGFVIKCQSQSTNENRNDYSEDHHNAVVDKQGYAGRKMENTSHKVRVTETLKNVIRGLKSHHD